MAILTETYAHNQFWKLYAENNEKEEEIKRIKEQIVMNKEVAAYHLQGCWIWYSLDNCSYLVRIAEIKNVVRVTEQPFSANPIVHIMVEGYACFYMEMAFGSVIKHSNSEFFSVNLDRIDLITTEKAFSIIEEKKILCPEVDLTFTNSLSQQVEFWDGKRILEKRSEL